MTDIALSKCRWCYEQRAMPCRSLGQTEGCPVLQRKAVETPDSKSRNPKDLAATDKVPLGVLPPVALIHTAQVMRSGSIKYGPANWRNEPIRTTVYINALMRHLMRYAEGEDIDQESGCPHLAHIASNCMILMDAQAQGGDVLTDDRYYASEEGPDIVETLLAEYEKANSTDD